MSDYQICKKCGYDWGVHSAKDDRCPADDPYRQTAKGKHHKPLQCV